MPIINQIVKGSGGSTTSIEPGYAVAIVSMGNMYKRTSGKSNNLVMWESNYSNEVRYTRGKNPKKYGELYTDLFGGGSDSVEECYYGGIVINDTLYYKLSHDSENGFTMWDDGNGIQIYTFGLNDPMIGDIGYQDESSALPLGTITEVYSSSRDIPNYMQDMDGNMYRFDSFGSNYTKWLAFDGSGYVYSGGNTMPCINETLWLDSTFITPSNSYIMSLEYDIAVVKYNNVYYAITSGYNANPKSYVGETNGGSQIYMSQDDFNRMSGQPVYDSRYLTNQIGTVQEVIF